MHFDGERTEVRNSLRGVPEPVPGGETVTWSTSSVNFELSPRLRGPEVTLHDGIRWHCHVPAGDAVVRLPGRTLRGTGYVEMLEMTVAPWTLPIRELRWGRAIGAKTSLVWIDWAGQSPLQVVLRDGVSKPAARITDDEVQLEEGTRFMLRDRAVIREESLASTVKPLRPALRILPSFLRGTVEHKWRSRFVTADDEGWAIHELITFAAD
jgi:hypothetical protein